MERDDLREAWEALEAHVSKTEKLNDLLVSQSATRGARTSLDRERRWLTIEVVLNYVAVVALGSFAADHLANAAAAVSAGVLAAYLVVVNVALIGIIAGLAQLDYDEPVLAVQTALERIAMRRGLLVATILVTGPLLWAPLLVFLISLAGLDALRVLGMPYIAANLALGALFAAAGYTVARLLEPHVRGSSWLARFVRALAGQEYREAAQMLDTIERFRSA